MTGPVTFFFGQRRLERFLLGPEDSHHLKRVLRFGEGDTVWCIDGSGTAYRVRIDRAHARAAEGVIVGESPEHNELPIRISLIQGRMLPGRMDWLVQKATELGVVEIRPIAGRPPTGPGRLRRWHRLARSAAKQCRRGRVPRIVSPDSLTALLAGLPAGSLKLWADPDGDVALPDLSPGQEVVLAVGPDKGFGPDEKSSLVEAGFRPVALGDRRLRAETAALVLLARVALSVNRDRTVASDPYRQDEIA